MIATLIVLSTLAAVDTMVRIPGTSVRFGTDLERVSTVGRFEPQGGTPGPGGITRPPLPLPPGTDVREGPLRFFGLDAVASLTFEEHRLASARFVVDPISPHSLDYLEDQLRRMAYRRSCATRSIGSWDCEWAGPTTVHLSLAGSRMTAEVRLPEPRPEPLAAIPDSTTATSPRDSLAPDAAPVTLTLTETDSLPPPIAIETCKPRRPDAARRDGVFGRVWVRVLVDVDGRVTDAQIERGIASLNDAALDCARRFRFAPYVVNGRPTRVWHPLALAFLLD